MATRAETVFDMDTNELADEIRQAADAVEDGFGTMYVLDEQGAVDDGPIYKTVFVKYVETHDE